MQPIIIYKCSKCNTVFDNLKSAEQCCNQNNKKIIENFKSKLDYLDTFSKEITSKEKYVLGVKYLNEIESEYNSFDEEKKIILVQYLTVRNNLITRLCRYYELLIAELEELIKSSDIFKPVTIDGVTYEFDTSNEMLIKMFAYDYGLNETIKKL